MTAISAFFQAIDQRWQGTQGSGPLTPPRIPTPAFWLRTCEVLGRMGDEAVAFGTDEGVGDWGAEQLRPSDLVHLSLGQVVGLRCGRHGESGRVRLLTSAPMQRVIDSFKLVSRSTVAWPSWAANFSIVRSSSSMSRVSIRWAISNVLVLSLIHISEPTRPY